MPENKPDLPPTPQPGEVWETDLGVRRFVRHAKGETVEWFSRFGPNECRLNEWIGWAIRTNARCILPAKESNK